MHDLATIQRLNREAHGREIELARARGQFVLARYTGLTLIEHSAHESHEAAAEASRARPCQIGERLTVLPPLDAAQAALVHGRDQSEDYVAA